MTAPDDRRKRVRFVRHWTVRTGSDHRALFVHVQVRNRRGPWRDLLLVSANLGGRFDGGDLHDLADRIERTGVPAVVAFQEGSDKRWLGDALRRHGYTLLSGSKVGQPATPLAASPGVRVRGSVWQLILARVNIGPGAGPDRNKPKWWQRSRLSVDGARFGASSWHVVPSQHKARRMWAAIRQATTPARALGHIGRPFFLIGDTNSDQDQPLSRWLRRHGLTSNHDQLGELPTRGRRSIDAVHCQRRLTLAA